MKKIINILILVFILTSCQNEKKLNGTWISAYEYNENDSLREPTTGIPFNEVITFENGIFKFQEFKYDGYENIRTDKFERQGNKFIIDENQDYFYDIIDPLTNDSIVINGMNSPLNRVYKRLEDSLKNKSSNFKLTGKKFIRNYRNWTDTIHFINESVYVSSAWEMGKSELKWERINHNGFDILFTDVYAPFIIKSKIGNDIFVSTFGSEKEDYILKEIE